ncbi:acetyl-CoA C-acetyltransferase [Alicyclobacillus cycloheptanicus]|uniref:acetyl-CoA C-acetyltransferase n=1 Tax=Alicyclobacillus cycloheptanicus TaxID=1457 RepID=A0ABT9XGP6_9BACL|nr:acetyl-CoA C-acetyltransferase [Alicyclobacillus cycloheptanicus]MDQ0189463.1 acetyl-CoA C-acetyltransferase [Alicyclobacillus cycloheptanicus]WDM02329.1 acetyl-CoA C-acetyltransferase [Alicyclobacillus cycloheptanicus]
MGKSVIVSAVRTPFGRLNGALAARPAVELGGIAIREALNRARVRDEEVEQVLMGMVLQGGAGQIPARQAARYAGLPWETPSVTVNKVCASGLRAVTLADALIRAGDVKVAVAGGMESMSNAPYAVPGARRGLRMGDGAVIDLMIHDGLTCAFHNVHMAVLGSEVAKEYGISREAQDAFALRSHQRAIAAIDAGILREEIVPVTVTQKREQVTVDTDEAPRRDTSLDKLAALSPVFDPAGTVTAGNAPGVNDGAGALVVMDETYAQQTGRQPLATILGYAEVAAEAKYIATTPGLAIQKLLQKTGKSISDIDLFEVNEAFAAVTLTAGKMLDWDESKVNVNGGAVALGHPIGASGARILTTLIYELRRRGGGLGIAAICSGAAQGDAVLVEVSGN